MNTGKFSPVLFLLFSPIGTRTNSRWGEYVQYCIVI